VSSLTSTIGSDGGASLTSPVYELPFELSSTAGAAGRAKVHVTPSDKWRSPDLPGVAASGSPMPHRGACSSTAPCRSRGSGMSSP
jgi:hypothetical protein